MANHYYKPTQEFNCSLPTTLISSIYTLKSIKDENWHNYIVNNRWSPEQGAKEQLIIYISDVIQHLTFNCLEGLEFQLWIGIICNT